METTPLNRYHYLKSVWCTCPYVHLIWQVSLPIGFNQKMKPPESTLEFCHGVFPTYSQVGGAVLVPQTICHKSWGVSAQMGGYFQFVPDWAEEEFIPGGVPPPLPLRNRECGGQHVGVDARRAAGALH